jgi:hypothetical protein
MVANGQEALAAALGGTWYVQADGRRCERPAAGACGVWEAVPQGRSHVPDVGEPKRPFVVALGHPPCQLAVVFPSVYPGSTWILPS